MKIYQSHHFGIETLWRAGQSVRPGPINRTILELKQESKIKMPVVIFAAINRTILELKLGHCLLLNSPPDPINRTILELKRLRIATRGRSPGTINRTILELKHAVLSDYTKFVVSINRTILELKHDRAAIS